MQADWSFTWEEGETLDSQLWFQLSNDLSDLLLVFILLFQPLFVFLSLRPLWCFFRSWCPSLLFLWTKRSLVFSLRSPARTRLCFPAVAPEVGPSCAGPRWSAGSRADRRTQTPPAHPGTCTHTHTHTHTQSCFGALEQSQNHKKANIKEFIWIKLFFGWDDGGDSSDDTKGGTALLVCDWPEPTGQEMSFPVLVVFNLSPDYLKIFKGLVWVFLYCKQELLLHMSITWAGITFTDLHSSHLH